jgi:hypothetical protein
MDGVHGLKYENMNICGNLMHKAIYQKFMGFFLAI